MVISTVAEAVKPAPTAAPLTPPDLPPTSVVTFDAKKKKETHASKVVGMVGANKF